MARLQVLKNLSPTRVGLRINTRLVSLDIVILLMFDQGCRQED